MEDIVHVGADSLVDRYFLLLERLGDTIEKLEENIYESSSDQVVRHIYQIKREASEFRRAVWPLREVINRLERDEGGLIIDDTKTFLRDLYDHTIQIIDTVESYRSLDHPCASPYGTTWQQSVNKGDNNETTRNAP